MAKRFWKGKKLGGKWELATSKALARFLTCSASSSKQGPRAGAQCGGSRGRGKGWVGGCVFGLLGLHCAATQGPCTRDAV